MTIQHESLPWVYLAYSLFRETGRSLDGPKDATRGRVNLGTGAALAESAMRLVYLITSFIMHKQGRDKCTLSRASLSLVTIVTFPFTPVMLPKSLSVNDLPFLL